MIGVWCSRIDLGRRRGTDSLLAPIRPHRRSIAQRTNCIMKRCGDDDSHFYPPTTIVYIQNSFLSVSLRSRVRTVCTQLSPFYFTFQQINALAFICIRFDLRQDFSISFSTAFAPVFMTFERYNKQWHINSIFYALFFIIIPTTIVLRRRADKTARRERKKNARVAQYQENASAVDVKMAFNRSMHCERFSVDGRTRSPRRSECNRKLTATSKKKKQVLVLSRTRASGGHKPLQSSEQQINSQIIDNN